jgi:hypothetical protein
VALGAGALAAKDTLQRTILLGLAGFVIMLGPTLLLSAHRHLVYLYAPHFFMALAVGALLGNNRAIPIVAAAIISTAILLPPLWLYSREYTIAHYLGHGEVNQAQFHRALQLLKPLASETTVFISGLEPFFNPFYFPPNSPLKTASKDDTIKVVVEQPETELMDRFCTTNPPKRFLRFDGPQGNDITSQVEASCARNNARSDVLAIGGFRG